MTFSYFKYFNEANKLNKEIRDNFNYVNYDNLILDLIKDELDFKLAVIIFPIIEDKTLLNIFLCVDFIFDLSS